MFPREVQLQPALRVRQSFMGTMRCGIDHGRGEKTRFAATRRCTGGRKCGSGTGISCHTPAGDEANITHHQLLAVFMCSQLLRIRDFPLL